MPKSIPMTVPISSLAPFDIEAARKAITPNIMYLMFVLYLALFYVNLFVFTVSKTNFFSSNLFSISQLNVMIKVIWHYIYACVKHVTLAAFTC